MSKSLLRRGAVLLVLSGWAYISGCGDGSPETSADAAERINAAGSGLVQVSQRGGERVVAKYLSPEYLARAEGESRGRPGAWIDSLEMSYGKTLSFHISVRRGAGEDLPGRGGGVDSSGVVDVESSRGMFRLESGGRTWEALCVLPESRVGESSESWFVVFGVAPEKELRDNGRITVIYTPRHVDGAGDAHRFTYRVEDILGPSIIASKN